MTTDNNFSTTSAAAPVCSTTSAAATPAALEAAAQAPAEAVGETSTHVAPPTAEPARPFERLPAPRPAVLAGVTSPVYPQPLWGGPEPGSHPLAAVRLHYFREDKTRPAGQCTLAELFEQHIIRASPAVVAMTQATAWAATCSRHAPVTKLQDSVIVGGHYEPGLGLTGLTGLGALHVLFDPGLLNAYDLHQHLRKRTNVGEQLLGSFGGPVPGHLTLLVDIRRKLADGVGVEAYAQAMEWMEDYFTYDLRKQFGLAVRPPHGGWHPLTHLPIWAAPFAEYAVTL